MTEVTVNVNNNTAPSLVSYMLTAVFFGYFALGFDNDPDSCYASPEHEQIWSTGSKNSYREIGIIFRLVSTIVFYTALLQIVFLS